MLTQAVAVVTGANSGLGLETARALAARGTHVVLAVRSQARAQAAMADIQRTAPAASLSFAELDLASLASVRGCAASLAAAHPAIDLLVNNAGVMAIPTRMTTGDGFEMQFGTNYLGHFALTLALLPALLQAPAPRVVSLGSLAAKAGRIAFEDPQLTRHYTPWGAYCQSKLACVMFAIELGRRATAANWPLVSAAAHPGWSTTNLQSTGPAMGLNRPSLTAMAIRLVEPLLAQSAADGAKPTLLAATSKTIQNGDYIGPNGPGGLKGAPALVQPPPAAENKANAAQLWALSGELTGAVVAG